MAGGSFSDGRVQQDMDLFGVQAVGVWWILSHAFIHHEEVNALY